MSTLPAQHRDLRRRYQVFISEFISTPGLSHVESLRSFSERQRVCLTRLTIAHLRFCPSGGTGHQSSIKLRPQLRSPGATGRRYSADLCFGWRQDTGLASSRDPWHPAGAWEILIDSKRGHHGSCLRLGFNLHLREVPFVADTFSSLPALPIFKRLFERNAQS